jgi:catechol 2,3-dioxygenase-like lactoylglutathione lyase family enzyme
VDDLDRAFVFYDPLLAILGYRATATSAAYLEWEGPGGWFILRPMRSDVPLDRTARGLHHVAWNADSREQVDGVHEFLGATGATILDPPQEFPQLGKGYYAVFFEDPNGIKLEVAYTP